MSHSASFLCGPKLPPPKQPLVVLPSSYTLLSDKPAIDGIELTKDSTSKGLNLLSSNLDLYRTEDTKDGIFLLGVKDGEPIKIAANNVSEGNGVILTDHVQTDAPIGVIQFVIKDQEE